MNPYDFSPDHTGLSNTLALQKAADQGGTIRIEQAGVYPVEGTVYLQSNTAIHFGAGVVLRRVPDCSGRHVGSHFFLNKGALSGTRDENITLDGLTIECNGYEAYSNAPVPGLRGQVAFFHVKNLRIEHFRCMDVGKVSYALQICDFEHLAVEHIEVEGQKDAIHLNCGKNFVIRDGRFRTNDDPIALNAHDYSNGAPQLGWIENGIIENCYDLPQTSTVGYFCRLLAGCWPDWFEGMEVQQSDTVVSCGRIYRVLMQPDGQRFISNSQPTHASGTQILDGISWYMTQENALYNCGCRNIAMRNLFLQKEREEAIAFNFENDDYCRSCYPGCPMPVQQNIVIDNACVQNRIPVLLRSVTPMDDLKIVNSQLQDSRIHLAALPSIRYQTVSHIMMSQNSHRYPKSQILQCDEGREAVLTVAE